MVDGEPFGEAEVDFDVVDSMLIDVNAAGVALLRVNKLDFFPECPLVGLLGELCANSDNGLPPAVRYFELEGTPVIFLICTKSFSPPIPLPTLLIEDFLE